MSAAASMRLLAKLMIHHPEHAPADITIAAAPALPARTQRERPEPLLTVPGIIAMVAWFYQIDSHLLRYGGRRKYLAYPRFIAYYLITELLGMNRSAIGHRFAADHTTVLHGLRVIADSMVDDAHLRDEVEILRLHITDQADAQTPCRGESALAQYIRRKYRR